MQTRIKKMLLFFFTLTSYVTSASTTLKENITPDNRPQQNSEEKRYFRSNSDLHKQKSDKPTYLYDEITEKEALSNNQVAYFIGYYQDGKLLRYEKIYNGKLLIYKEIK